MTGNDILIRRFWRRDPGKLPQLVWEISRPGQPALAFTTHLEDALISVRLLLGNTGGAIYQQALGGGPQRFDS